MTKHQAGGLGSAAPLWQVRQPCMNDLGGLVSLEKACFSIPWQADSLALELSDPKNRWLLVASDRQNQLIAYGALHRLVDEAELVRLAVLPSWRGQGIGRDLLEALLSLAKTAGMHAVYLEVRESNRPAQSLYLSLGFSKVGCRQSYYADTREDAIIMLKRFAVPDT